MYTYILRYFLLDDYELVENLESTKRTAVETQEKVLEAQKTERQINETREVYRPVAQRSSLLYFILNDLHKIHPMYQFSLKAFNVVFIKAIDASPSSDDVSARVVSLIDTITFSVFQYTSRGLFETDKLTLTSQMTFLILMIKGDLDLEELDFLLRYPADVNVRSPVDFLSNSGWGGIKALALMSEFHNLDRDIEGSPKRWKKFVESECPEKEKFPQEWKNKTSLQKLCMMRALRPDRMTYAMRAFIEQYMGVQYVESRNVEFAQSYKESTSATPIFFILSPGVDPLKDVEALGRRLGFTQDRKNFHNISLGQGQEVVAEAAIDLAAKEGHWVILQVSGEANKYVSGSKRIFIVGFNLECPPCGKMAANTGKETGGDIDKCSRRLSRFCERRTRPHCRLAHHPARHPRKLHQNHQRTTDGNASQSACCARQLRSGKPQKKILCTVSTKPQEWSCVLQDTLEMCSKESEFKAILFALCYFHAVVCERRKFGAQGWNSVYPYNNGDLTISCDVLYNYLEANVRVPWEDLRYLFGEIMYGGHITDDWDRRLCRTYLEEYMNTDVLAGLLIHTHSCLTVGLLSPCSACIFQVRLT